MARHREWTDVQLRRMRAAFEAGTALSVIAARFGIGLATVQDLAKKHGWSRK